MQPTSPDGSPAAAGGTGTGPTSGKPKRSLMVGPLGDEKRYRLVVEASRSAASELWHTARPDVEDPRRWAVLTDRPDETTAHVWQPVWKARAERIRARDTAGVPTVDDTFAFHRRDGAALHMPGDCAVLIHEWFEGYPLRDWVRLHRPRQDRILQILRSLAATVDSLHVPSDGAPLVHGDISPDNVIASVPAEGTNANDAAFRADVALLGFDIRTGDDTLSPTLDRGAMVRIATFLLIGTDPGAENDSGAGPLGWRVADAFSRVGGVHNLPHDVREFLSSDAHLQAGSMAAWCDQLNQALTGVWSRNVVAPEAPPIPTDATPGAAPVDVAAATAAAQAAAQQWAAPPLPTDAEQAAADAATLGYTPTGPASSAERIAAAAADFGGAPPDAPGVAKTVSYIPAEDATAGFGDLPSAPPPTTGAPPHAGAPVAPTPPLMAGPAPTGEPEPVRNPVTGAVLASAAGLVGLRDATGVPLEPVPPEGWVPPSERVMTDATGGKLSRKERRERKRAAKAAGAAAVAAGAAGVATVGIPDDYRKPTGFDAAADEKAAGYTPKTNEEEAEADAAERKRRRLVTSVLGAVALVGLVGAAVWFFVLRGGDEGEVAATTTKATTTTAAPVTSAPETTAPPTTQAPTAPVQPAPAPATTGDPCAADVPVNGGWQVIMWSEFTQNAGPAQAEAEYQRLIANGFPNVKLLRGDDWCSLRPGTWAVAIDEVLGKDEAIAREITLQRQTGDPGIYARCVGTVPAPCEEKGPGR